MKRILLCIACLLVLGVAAGSAQAQEPYTPTTSDQTAQAQTQAPTTEQPAADPATSDPSMSSSSELPATASPWPLVGLVGFASLAAGLYLPRRRAKS